MELGLPQLHKHGKKTHILLYQILRSRGNHTVDSNAKMRREKINFHIKLDKAKEKLHEAWDKYGVTNAQVLQAGKEVDLLLNEYLRLEKTN